MTDYTMNEVALLKKALEDKILQGLSSLLSDFQRETGLGVGSMTTTFIDVSTLDGPHYLINGVKVSLALPQQLVVHTKGEHYGQENESQGESVPDRSA